MTSTTMSSGADVELGRHGTRALQRYVLQRSHPTSIVLDSTALMWGVYLLWQHNWQAALLIVVIARLLAYAATRNVDREALSRTMLGRIAVLHLHPVNLAMQTIGAIVGLVGVWNHSTLTILSGISLVLVGHAFGWEDVHRSLRIGRTDR